MSPEIPSAAPAKGMSEVSRIAGVFFEPKNAFADIAARPRWIVPLLLIVLSTAAFTYTFTQKIGWDRFMRQTLEQSSRAAQMTPEQREQAVAIQARFAPIMGFAGAIVGVPLYNLAAAGVLLLLFNSLFSAQLRYKQVFSVMCYAGLSGLVFSALAIVVMFLKNPDDFNLRNPLAFNPGAFMDPSSSSKFLYALASSIDLFTLWSILLIATGISAAGRKLSFGSAVIGVMIPWAVWVLIKSSLAMLG